MKILQGILSNDLRKGKRVSERETGKNVEIESDRSRKAGDGHNICG